MGRREPDDEDVQRKERVLHTRVPVVLEEELRRLADSLRVPLSNLVRAFLEDAVTAADAVGKAAEDELRGVAKRVAKGRTRLVGLARPGKRSAPLAGVLGFQSMRLAKAAECAVCGRAMVVGERAHLGVRDEPGPRVIVGVECVPGNIKERDDE